MTCVPPGLLVRRRLFVFGSLYFSTMPRELHGCCKGSTYTYQLDNFCNAAFSNPDGTGSTSPEACAKVPGEQTREHAPSSPQLLARETGRRSPLLHAAARRR